MQVSIYTAPRIRFVVPWGHPRQNSDSDADLYVPFGHNTQVPPESSVPEPQVSIETNMILVKNMSSSISCELRMSHFFSLFNGSASPKIFFCSGSPHPTLVWGSSNRKGVPAAQWIKRWPTDLADRVRSSHEVKSSQP